MKRVFTACASVCVLASMMSINAEARAEAAADEGMLDEITVFATRNPIPAFDYPGQVTVIDREVILDFNPSTIGDVFDAIPGAQFDSGARRTGDSPSVRGLSGSGVQIFLDGARQSFISGHDGRFFADPELVSAVEVVRGPTSALYGSGALGGIIAARTITAEDVLEEGETLGLRMNTGYQSVNDEFRVGATGVWRSADGAVDTVGHMTYRNSGDIDLGNDTTLPSDDEILSSLLKVTFQATDDLQFFTSFMRYSADSNDPQNPQGNNLDGPDNELVFRDALNTTVQGGLNWNPSSDLINLNLVSYYSDNSVEEDTVDDPRTTDRQVETFGFTLDNRSVFTLSEMAAITFTYGGEYYRDEQTGLDNESADGSRGGAPDGTTDFYGVFVQADFALTDLGVLPGELNIIPGFRWDRFKTAEPAGDFDIDESEISPKVGVSYKPVPQLLIFGNYAQGFRAPSFNEAFADGVHFSIPNLAAPPGPYGPVFVSNLFIANPDLVPEESATWEVGVGIDFDNVVFDGDSFTAKASYYNSDVDNLIGLDVNTPVGCFVASPFVPACGSGSEFGNTSQNVNILNAELEGVELEFNYDSAYFYTRGALTTINGIDADSGEFLEGVLSPNTLFIDSGVKFPMAGLRTGVRLFLSEEFDEVNTDAEIRDGFAVADLYAVWEAPSGSALDGIRIDLGLDNFTDADYEVVNAGVSQPGRNVKASVSWRQAF